MVLNADLLQDSSQVLLVEMRELSGAWESPDVHQGFNLVLSQQAEELVQGRFEWPMVKIGLFMGKRRRRKLLSEATASLLRWHSNLRHAYRQPAVRVIRVAAPILPFPFLLEAIDPIHFCQLFGLLQVLHELITLSVQVR